MPLRPVIASLLLLSSAVHLTSAAELRDGSDFPHFQKGYLAMEDGLYGVALRHFASVPITELNDGDRESFTLLLAETEIRNGLPENLEKALLRLQSATLQSNERATYWRARAYLVQEKYDLALTELTLLEKATQEAIRRAALRTRLHLYLAQKNYAKGLALIESQLTQEDSAGLLLEKAKFQLAAGQLDEVAALLGLSTPQEASTSSSGTESELRTAVTPGSAPAPVATPTPPAGQEGPAWDFLRARFFLQQGGVSAGQRASENFLRVLAAEDSTPLSPTIKESALLGLGHAFVQAGEPIKAVDHYLDLLSTDPNPELVPQLFRELKRFIPNAAITQTLPSAEFEAQGREITNLLKRELASWVKVDEEVTLASSDLATSDPRRLYAASLYGQLLAQESRNLLDPVPSADPSQPLNGIAEKKAALQKEALVAFRIVMNAEQGKSLLVTQEATYEWARLLSEIPASHTRGLNQLKSLAVLETIRLTVRTAAYHQLGLLASGSGADSEALTYFNQATQLHAQDESAYNASLLALSLTLEDPQDLLAPTLPWYQENQQKIKSHTLLRNLHYAEALYYVRSNDEGKAIALLKALLAKETQKEGGLPAFPQLAQARLLLAELLLSASQGQPDKVEHLLKEVDPTQLSSPQLLRFSMTRLRLQQQQGEAITPIALEGLELPQKSADLLRLKTAEAFYLNEEYNKAQRLFLELAETLSDPAGKRSALFFAAQSAMKVGTPKSREEGLALFQQLIARSPSAFDQITSRSCLASAQYYLNLGQAKEALRVLKKIPHPRLDPKAGSLPADQLSFLLLLAQSHIALGGNDHQNYTAALHIYQNLAQQSDLTGSWQARLAYRQGLCLEGLAQPNEALALYHRVIRQDETRVLTAEDWKWYYRNGFRAVSLLEKQKNWPAAHTIAQRLATHQDAENKPGPRAEEAQKRAQALKQAHGL